MGSLQVSLDPPILKLKRYMNEHKVGAPCQYSYSYIMFLAFVKFNEI